MPALSLILLLFLLPTSLPAQGVDAAPPTADDQREVVIGVLSHRGDVRTRSDWEPTADYLTARVPGHRFSVLPLDFDAVEPAVANGKVDFVLVNPAIYVALELNNGVTRIATLRNGTGEAARNLFGGVIFTRAERGDIDTLKDLKGKRFMAVNPTSLGGFQMAQAELLHAGIDPQRDLQALLFAGIHDQVVRSVQSGEADAGTVRTDVLEQMAKAGDIDLAEFKVLGARQSPDFPLLHSTPLFPEWPFGTLALTPNELAQAVAVALLQMPADSHAAIVGDYAGWTVPLDYQNVHRLLRELRHAPYDEQTPFTLLDALARYWLAVLIGALALLTMALLTSRVLQLNHRLSRANTRLERRHQLILDSVAEGIYGVDLNGYATFVNKAMERMTGWRAEELIGNETHEIIHHTRTDGEPHPRADCPVYATFRDEQSRFVDEDVFWRRDGTSFPVEYSATPIRDDQGYTIGTVVVCRDITERREAADRFRRQEAEQAHFTRLSTLGEMASGIAHELNQPLTAITTNARACVRMIEAERATMTTCSEVMTKIAEQAERAGEVIRHIRRFVRKEEPEMAPVAVSDIFETVLVLMREDARRAGVVLHRQIGFGANCVMAQRTQIEQVLLNLVRNALEAMSGQLRERRVLLLARRNGDVIEVRVVDTGPGLGKGSPEHLFEPFVTTKPQGLGVGLSISHGIVEAHGGRLRVDSTPGIGATFFFSLPHIEDCGGVKDAATPIQSGGSETDYAGEHL
jgi:phosphate/phosphite/phosphonate ABC transporter binding protein